MESFFPDPRFRSPTAVQNKGDARDENIYSAIVAQTGGSGNQSIFTNPKGQAIPKLGTYTPVQAHHLVYSDVTTNLTKAGELGSGIGDAAVRYIGINVEQAGYVQTTSVLRLYGAGDQELKEILTKISFVLSISTKRQIQGSVDMFPAVGGAFGSMSQTGNLTAAGVATNGWPGFPRKLKIPILVARTDTLEGIVAVASGASLSFSTQSGTADGQSTLIRVILGSSVLGDVR